MEYQTAMRIFYCTGPAIVVGSIGGLVTLSWTGFAIFFACMFGLGWQITSSNASRGEDE